MYEIEICMTPTFSQVVLLCVGLLRVSEYSDIRGSEYKIEYEYSSLPQSLDRDLFFFFFFVNNWRFNNWNKKFFTKWLIEIFPMTTVLINNVFHLNTFVSRRLVTCIWTLHYR